MSRPRALHVRARAGLSDRKREHQHGQRRHGGDPGSTRIEWDIFVLAGDPAHPDATKRGTVKGDGFGSPDGLRFDDRGVRWIETGVSASALKSGGYARLGNNQLLAAEVRTGEVRRLLVGPSSCEITGCAFTPNGGSMVLNIQYPGEAPSERGDPRIRASSPTGPTSIDTGGRGRRPSRSRRRMGE
jgi:secreted PhoX family phosphatase